MTAAEGRYETPEAIAHGALLAISGDLRAHRDCGQHCMYARQGRAVVEALRGRGLIADDASEATS